MNACASCMTPVIWATTSHGKAIPLDTQARTDGNITLDVDGVAHFNARGGGKYVSHFSTCPNAKQHRKSRPGAHHRGAHQ